MLKQLNCVRKRNRKKKKTYMAIKLVIDAGSFQFLLPLSLLLQQFLIRLGFFLFSTFFFMLHLLHSSTRHFAELFVGADPQLGVDFVRGNDLFTTNINEIKKSACDFHEMDIERVRIKRT